MENLLTCVLMLAITFLVSFYTARACLCLVIRFMARPGFGSDVRRARCCALDGPVMTVNRQLAERAALRVKQQNCLNESTMLHECDYDCGTAWPVRNPWPSSRRFRAPLERRRLASASRKQGAAEAALRLAHASDTPRVLGFRAPHEDIRAAGKLDQ